MAPFTLHDLRCFDAVVREGGFQPAAAALHRSHPAVFAAVARLERQLGLALFERGGYRVRLTAAGRSFHGRAQSLLRESEGLQAHASQLAMGEETGLHVVLGDLCPRAQVLGVLGRFFADRSRTRLHLHFEAVTGPWERLFEDDADLIVHRIDKRDARLEWIDLCDVALVPVVAPALLAGKSPRAATPARMRDFTQCVMRDTARDPAPEEYFTVDGASRCTVADHTMKKEIIVQGLGGATCRGSWWRRSWLMGACCRSRDATSRCAPSSWSPPAGATARMARSPSGCGPACARRRLPCAQRSGDRTANARCDGHESQ